LSLDELSVPSLEDEARLRLRSEFIEDEANRVRGATARAT
jgi:hypothetical protein